MAVDYALTSARLRALNAVVDEGNFTAAAQRLGVSRPAIRQAIADLEEAYNLTFFEKRGRDYVPSEIVLQVAPLISEISTLEAEVHYLLSQKQSFLAGTLRIGLGNSQPGIGIIQAFQNQFPSVQIEAKLGNYFEIINAVLDHQVDIGVLPEVPVDKRFVRESCCKQEIVAIVPSNHPLSQNGTTSLRDLSAFDLIFRSSGSITQRVLNAALKKMGLNPKPKAVLQTREGVCEAVACGMGIGFIWKDALGHREGLTQLAIADIEQDFFEYVFKRSDTQSVLVDHFFAQLQK